MSTTGSVTLSKNTSCLISLVILILAGLWAFAAQLPSAQDYDSADPIMFSQKKALKHLKIISEKPHFVGSPAHGEVREYLVHELQQLGLSVETFEHLSTHFHRFDSANTTNIIA